MAVSARLKIMRGSNAGRILEINVPQYVIGRAPGCSLRPQSDAISRQHCAILTSGTKVTIRDLKSRNGTILNGEKIESEVQLKDGDELQVGPLFFQVLMTVVVPAEETKLVPTVTETVQAADEESVIDSPAVTPLTGLPSDSGLISEWLLAEDMQTRSKETAGKETRQFKLDETANVPILATDTQETDAKSKGKGEADKKKGKKEFGKLPKQAQDAANSSRDAAAETLKKMYNRGL
jgi:pSer/pThr/pTyr-binding forkhead associated (FHA) protein